MIGICCNQNERETVREFFQLFKTPWEFWILGRYYEVIISTVYETPELKADLKIVFSSEPTNLDTIKNTLVDSSSSGYLVDYNGIRLPIYGKLARLRGPGHPLICGQIDSEVIGIAFSEPPEGILRIGYDLFSEVAFLLSEGQPGEYALIPTLELHISLLREWIVRAGIPLVEIPPIPWGYNFIACLTHDVDFAGIRQHKFDHTMWGFIYRALVGSFLGFLGGTYPFNQLLKNWIAVLSLPLVYMGIIRDFWDEFKEYTEIEKDACSTFFLIPFKKRPGDKVQEKLLAQRATSYDINDVQKQVHDLINQGFEVGLHGIDAWHDVDKGKQELNQIVRVIGQNNVGVRMHWLCFDLSSPAILEEVGFKYDSTFGYNRVIGYRGGTTQVFRPLGVKQLLEVPLHIQDTAMFIALALTSTQAWDLCTKVMNDTARYGGVMTVLWHMRSLAPERLWGEFYKHMLHELRARGAWVSSAGQVVQWFRQRRSIRFEDSRFENGKLRLWLKPESQLSQPFMFIRVYNPQDIEFQKRHGEDTYKDILYNGDTYLEIPLD